MRARNWRRESEADLVNFVACALTALTMPHWRRGHPFLAINGNKPGVGKSTLARVLGVLVEGEEPPTVTWLPDDAEFEIGSQMTRFALVDEQHVGIEL